METEIDNFLKLVHKRRCIRRFKPDPIPEGYIEKILEAARWAMSGANGQPWEFVVVTKEETKNKIFDIYFEHAQHLQKFEMTRFEELRHPGASQPTKRLPTFKDAPAIIVISGDPRTYFATVIGTHFFSGEGATFYKNLANATQILHLAAAALGLGSQWVSINLAAEWKLKALLGIPDLFRIYTIVPIGYAAYEPAPSYRRDLKEIVHYEQYDMSRYRSDEDVINFIASLRKRTQPTYRV